MIKITLPYAPSSNTYWRNWRGRMVLSKEARAYKLEVAARFIETFLGTDTKPLAGSVCVTLHVYRPRRVGDLDNRLKQVFDALNGLAWIDDKQIVELHAFRGDDKDDPRIEIEVSEVEVSEVEINQL